MNKQQAINCVVYRLDRPWNGVPCYIGISSKKGRPEAHFDDVARGRHYNRYLTNIIKKAGGRLPYVILYKGLTWEEACALEVELIKFYGRADKKLGPLANRTDGGDGCPGATWNLSEESKRNISAGTKAWYEKARAQGLPLPGSFTAGKKRSPQTEEQKRKTSLLHIGRKHLPEFGQKVSASLKARAARLKEEGKFVPSTPKGLVFWLTPEGKQYRAFEPRSPLDTPKRKPSRPKKKDLRWFSTPDGKVYKAVERRSSEDRPGRVNTKGKSTKAKGKNHWWHTPNGEPYVAVEPRSTADLPGRGTNGIIWTEDGRAKIARAQTEVWRRRRSK